MSDIGDYIGQMNEEWISEQLSDFTYTFEETDGEFVAKMNLLSETYNLTADDLISDVIAFATNSKRTCLNLSFLELFEQTVLVKKADQHIQEALHSVSQTPRVVLGEKKIAFEVEESPDLDASSYIREIEAESTLDEKYLKFTPDRSAAASIAYQNRKNKGKLLANHCGKYFGLDVRKKNEKEKRKIRVELCSSASLNSALSRYGNEKDVERIEEICSRIELLSEAIREANSLSFESPDIVSSEPFVICGQIFDESGDQLHASTCSIQSLDGGAATVGLDLSKLTSYSLFPGKVVAMKGTCENSSTFIPTELYEPSSMPSAVLIPQQGVEDLCVWCAAGPFTSSDTFSFEQLYDFLELAAKESPDAIILMGPFIDRYSKAARSSGLTRTFSELFESLLVNICDVLRESKTRLIIVPSKKDANALPFYPVAPFEVSKECKKGLYEEVTFVPDPAVIRIAGVEFALSNSEILQHLGRDEIHLSENSENEDRMARLVSHLISYVGQRSLYPLYPPPSGVSQCISKMIKTSELSEVPHVIILSSLLAPMVKVVDGCLCVSLNALARGSYMKLDINLMAFENKNTSRRLEEYCDLKLIRL